MAFHSEDCRSYALKKGRADPEPTVLKENKHDHNDDDELTAAKVTPNSSAHPPPSPRRPGKTRKSIKSPVILRQTVRLTYQMSAGTCIYDFKALGNDPKLR